LELITSRLLTAAPALAQVRPVAGVVVDESGSIRQQRDAREGNELRRTGVMRLSPALREMKSLEVH
jgi:hypothetical protein